METRDVVGAVLNTMIKVVLTVLVVILVYRGAITGYNFGYRVFKQEPMTLGEGRTVTVTIKENMSVKEIGELFLQKGLIKDTTLFMAQYYLSEFRISIFICRNSLCLLKLRYKIIGYSLIKIISSEVIIS